MLEILRKKRDGLVLNEMEIEYLVRGIVDNTIPDYQLSAFTMATYFKGMTLDELISFTKAMVYSGDVIDFSGIEGFFCDKHSTGGVGDKVTLILAPIIAACGVKMPKMSGRGLGHTGGTIDKLESIPGFTTEVSPTEFLREINTIGLGLIQQSGQLAPADKKLYAIRDVTATVESIPLIASSVVSKKIASGNKHIVFDVKVGQGAFMKNIADGKALAQTMVALVKSFGGDSRGVLTAMEEPLGYAVGNSIEVIEAIDTLKGEGPEDVLEVTKALAVQLLLISGKSPDEADALKRIDNVIKDGSALEKFRALIVFQNGNGDVIETYSLFPQSKNTMEITAEKSGYVHGLNAEVIGASSMLLGSGRAQLGDTIDLSAGIYLHKKIGDKVVKGESLCTCYWDFKAVDVAVLKMKIRGAYLIEKNTVKKKPIVLGIVK